MFWKVLPVLALAVVLAPICIEAQQSEWGQCGGISYDGQISCRSGWVCSTINA